MIDPPPLNPSEEQVDLVDDENRIVGRASRREVRGKNLLHRGVGIIVFNPNGQIYVHRRTDTKDVFPGLYDMFVGGVVASGESYATAARREVREELGVAGPAPEFLFTHLYLGDRNRSWIQVYQTIWDGPIRHQPEEIVWGAWFDPSEVLPLTQSEAFVPDGLEIYHRYLEWLHQPEGLTREEIP